jgi:hypothetical protein
VPSQTGHDGVVWELDEVVLFVGYHDTLGALARETVAVPCTERAGDRAAVTNRVKLGVAHRVRKTALALVHAGSVEAAVVGNLSLAVSPEAWVEVLAVHRNVGRRQTGWFQFVLNLHLDHALVEDGFVPS